MRAFSKISSAALLAAGALSPAAPASAQEYPAKYVRIIAGSVGAMPDIVTRHLAKRLGERWHQTVVVENRARVTISSDVAAKSPPDGYTLLMADRTSHAVAPSLYKDLSYDPVKDFAPITLVARSPMVLLAHPALPAGDLRGFVDYAKQRPGAIDYAAAGPGTANHLAGELLKQQTGIDLVAVQYKGTAAAMAAILNGEVKAGFILVPNALPHVKAGKVKAYAITSSKRFSGAPDIPTTAEAGLPGFEEDLWIGMFAPARTPAALIGKLNRDIVEILRTPEMGTALLALGAEPAPGTPEELAVFVKSETAKMKKVIELAGIRAQ